MKNLNLAKKVSTLFVTAGLALAAVVIAGVFGQAVLYGTAFVGLITGVGAAGLLVCLVVTLAIVRDIKMPIIFNNECWTLLGDKADISISAEEQAFFDAFAQRRDEFGHIFRQMLKLLHYLRAVADNMERITDGDLSIEVKALSELDVLNQPLSKLVESLSTQIGDIKIAADQVSSGASQVSNSAQGLASGASEQSASVEELSAAVSEITSMIKQSDHDSEIALKNSNNAATLMGNSKASMQDMMNAMESINESAQSISKVIKVIDDIAFQTNILALNAAVEAARAGVHGKGFAVVAEEVRNLAAKSAEAAKETTVLIEGDTAHVQEGIRAVQTTGENLEAVDKAIADNAELIKEIATLLEKQADEINVVNKGMEQISSVSQANAATAEESAAASQQLSSQSVILNEIVAHFKLKGRGYSSGGGISAPKADGFALEVEAR